MCVMFERRITNRSFDRLDLCYRHFLLAREAQDTFPIVFDNYCNRMNWMGFPHLAFIDLLHNGAVGHLFMFASEDEKGIFLNANPKIKKICQ